VKKFVAILLVLAMSLSLVGCYSTDKVASKEQATVQGQDKIYQSGQPIPVFNFSLPRDLWIQFYKAQTGSVVRTWSVGIGYNGTPVTEVMESVGYPIPMDTQLSNPQKLTRVRPGENGEGEYIEGVVPQAEPNGLYTSPNTNATIVMQATDKGVTPVYLECNVLCFPYKVVYDERSGLFVKDGDAQLKLDVKGK
jgi:hypothetical protein